MRFISAAFGVVEERLMTLLERAEEAFWVSVGMGVKARHTSEMLDGFSGAAGAPVTAWAGWVLLCHGLFVRMIITKMNPIKMVIQITNNMPATCFN